MNHISLNIIFFGSGKYVIPIIKVLKTNFNLKLVITTEKNSTDPIIKYCATNNIKYISIKTFSDINYELENINYKFQIAVLASFGLIIPQSILNLFPKGIINIHPSLLPRYRGTTPVQSAILNGDTITGVSVMLLDAEMDHGPILSQEKNEMLDTDTAETLYTRLFTIGSQMLINIIPKYLENKLVPISQKHENATYTKPLTRDSGYINFENSKVKIQKSKELEIARMVRAYYPWPGVWTRFQKKIIKFLPSSCHPELVSGSTPILIQIEGKKPVSIKDFINGYAWAKVLLKESDLL